MSNLPFRERSTQMPVLSSFIRALNDFNFSSPTQKTVNDLTALLVEASLQAEPRVSLGFFDSREYALLVEPLGPNSLNSTDNRREGSVYELLKDLKCTNINGISDNESSCKAFALGRLCASHHPDDKIAQSHWVILLDQSKQVWALYAKDIDITDSYGRSTAYDISTDTAFGADYTRKAVLLGPLTELPFQSGTSLHNSPQICALDWSTTFAMLQNFKSTISLCVLQQIRSVDAGCIKKPSYGWKNQQGRIIDIAYLQNLPGYMKFCNETELLNRQSNGFIVGRPMMEAAWCEVLIERLVDMFGYAEDRQRSENFLVSNLECLTACLSQMNDMLAQRYWLGGKLEYPELDTISKVPDNPTVNDPSELANWVLELLQEKTNAKRGSKDRKPAKTNEQTNHMDLHDANTSVPTSKKKNNESSKGKGKVTTGQVAQKGGGPFGDSMKRQTLQHKREDAKQQNLIVEPGSMELD